MATPAIGRRDRWLPGPSARINWSHPLAQGLQTLWTPRFQIDSWSTTGTVSRSVGTYGNSFSVAASATLVTPSSPMTSSTGSVVIVLRLTAAPSGGGFNIGGSLNDPSRWGAHLPYGDGTVYFDVSDSGNRLSYAGHTWRNNDVWALVNGPVGGQRIYVNGRVAASGAQRTASYTASGTWGAGQHGLTPNGNTGEVSMMAAWSRELSANEVAAIAADPFSFIDS